MSGQRRRARLWTAVRWTTGVAIVALLAFSLDPADLGARLGAADLPLAILGILGLTAVHLVPAETWRLLCRRLGGARLPWLPSVAGYYAAQALGGITPANVGGDLYRVHALRGSDGGFETAVAPVVVQRSTSYLALSLLGGAALAFLLAVGAHVSPWLLVPAVGVALLGAAGAGLLLVAPGPLARLRTVLIRLLGGDAAEADAGSWRRRLASGATVGIGLGLVFHLAGVLLTALLLAAVSPASLSPAALAAIAVARLSLAIPISPSGLGFQEGALSALFVGIGLAPETALAALLLARVSLVTTTLVGALALGIGGHRERLAVVPSGSPHPSR